MPLFVAAFFLSCAQSAKKPEAGSEAISNPENLSPVPASVQKETVLLIGETHYFTPFGAYEYIFNKVVTDEGVCIGVEFPYEPGDFSNSIKKLKTRISAVKNQEEKARIKRVTETYEKLLVMAQAKRLKLVGIDDKNHYLSELNAEQRSKAMAENITRLMSSKSCTRIVAILGKAHLTLGSSRKSNVKLLLGQAGIPSTSVNLQMTNEAGVPDEYQSFEASGLQAPVEFEWVENKTLQKMTRVLPNIQNDLSVWQEFDWTLLIPLIFKSEKL